MNLLHTNDKLGQYPESWYAASATPLPEFERLEEQRTCDVCVIGGGYTGLSTALHLAKAGVDVVLLEAHRVGWGASGRNGGQVGAAYNISQPDLVKQLGEATANALWQLSVDAVATVRELIEQYNIDCDWVNGIISAEWKTRALAELDPYIDYMHKHYAFDQLQALSAQDMQQQVGTDAYAGGLLDSYSGHLHPLKYALGLAAAANELGVSIYERSEVTELNDQGRLTVSTNSGSVSAEQAVLACNGYLGNLESSLGEPVGKRVSHHVMPINNFMVATEPLGTDARGILASNAAVADSKFVVNYFRLSKDNRLLFGGGESYGYHFPADIRQLVAKPLLKVYPQLQDANLDYAWGGTLAITRNRMPCFSRSSKSVLNASGYSGHGVALATQAGKVLSKALQGDMAEFDRLSNVTRTGFPGGNRLRLTLLTAAMRWYTLLDRLP